MEWRLPRYNTIHRLLINPVYAGAYVFGRTGSQIRIEVGRKLIMRGMRRPQKDWEVLIRDHHEGYISWRDYENNQRIINGNANMKGEMVAGSVRNGGGLLVGLLRCGRCGRKLRVLHNGLRGVARYVCNDANVNHGRWTKCIAFGNMRIDAAVSADVLSLIAPLGLDAALQPSRIASALAPSGGGRSIWRWSRRAMKQRAHTGNMMRLIRKTVWSPATSSDDGMNGSRRWRGCRYRRLKPNWVLHTTSSRPHWRIGARRDFGVRSRSETAMEPSGRLAGDAEKNFAGSV